MSNYYIQQSSECDYLFKVLLIGNSGVGKSCMLMRFSENQFTNHFYNTIGVDFKIKVFQIDKSTVKLQIWDTAGQDRFRTITSSYYRGAQGIIIVFDVTDRESLIKLDNGCKKLINLQQNQLIKYQLEIKQIILKEEYQSMKLKHLVFYFIIQAKSFNISYIETSAKTNINIENCFSLITRQIIQRVGKPNQNQKSKIGMKLQQNSPQQQQIQNKKGVEQDSQCCMP